MKEMIEHNCPKLGGGDQCTELCRRINLKRMVRAPDSQQIEKPTRSKSWKKRVNNLTLNQGQKRWVKIKDYIAILKETAVPDRCHL